MNAISSSARSVMRRSSASRCGRRSALVMKPVVVRLWQPDLDVVEHAHVVEQRHVLERPADADFRNGVAGLAEDRASFKEDVAAVGDVEPREAIEERRLAGAVGADEADDLPRRNVKRYAVEGDNAAEAHRDVLNAQKCVPACARGRTHRRCRNHGRRNLSQSAFLLLRGVATCRIVGPTRGGYWIVSGCWSRGIFVECRQGPRLQSDRLRRNKTRPPRWGGLCKLARHAGP